MKTALLNTLYLIKLFGLWVVFIVAPNSVLADKFISMSSYYQFGDGPHSIDDWRGVLVVIFLFGLLLYLAVRLFR